MQKIIYSAEYETLRKWLQSKRTEKGLTQRVLAALLEVPNSLIAKVEIGEHRLDVIEYLRFCQKLGVDPNEGIAAVREMME